MHSCSSVGPSRRLRSFIFRSLLGAGVFAGVSLARADDVFFTNPAPGADWFTGTNWSTGNVPGAFDAAVIDEGYSAQILSGAAAVDFLDLGDSTFGSLTVSGSGARLVVETQLAVGIGEEDGSAMMVSGGASVYAEEVLVGYTAGGSLTVTGAGSILTSGSNFGGIMMASGTSGALTVSDGGQVRSGGDLTSFGGLATIAVSGTGSVLDVFGINMGSDGTLAVTNGGRVNTADDTTLGGETGFAVTVEGPGSMIVASDTFSNFDVGSDGHASLAVSSGGTATVGALSLGTENLSDTGVVTVSGPGSAILATFGVSVGDVGSGTMTISNGGRLSNVSLNGQNYIARAASSTGTMLITGTGSIWDTEGLSLTIASGSNSRGTLTITDGGVLDTNGGGLFLASSTGALATVTQTSGTVYAGTVIFGRGTSVYHLEGGVLLVGGNGIRGSTGMGAYTLDLAGGTIRNVDNTFSSTLTGVLRAGTVTSYDSNGLPGTWSGTLAGAGGLNKIGEGGLTLSGNNTFSGGMTLTSGSLSLGSNTAVGTGTLTFAGASVLQTVTATRTLTNDIVINPGVSGTIGGTLALGVSGRISGSGTLAKVGTGTLVLSGSNSYAGGTRLAGGSLSLASDYALGTGTLSVMGNSSIQASGSRTVGNDIFLGTGFTGTVAGTQAVTLAGAISGDGNLAKANTGHLTITGSNSYTGVTTLTSGSVTIGNDYAFGTGTLALAGATIKGDGMAHTVANATTFTNGVLISGSSNLTFTGSWRNINNGNIIFEVSNTGTTSFTGNFNLANGATGRTVIYTVGAEALSLVSGTVVNGSAGASSLSKAGGGTLVLSGNNTYSGTTNVTAGLLVAESDTAFGTSLLNFNGGTLAGGGAARTLGNTTFLAATTANISGTTNLTFTGTTTSGTNVTLNISNTGTTTFANTFNLSNSANARTITFNTDGVTVVSGNIVSGATGSAGNLVKTGDGVLVLDGGNTYTGTTTVSEGLLAVNGSIAGAARVEDGATLAGSGTIGGAVVVEGGGVLAPGNSPGQLTLLSSLTLEDGAVLLMEFSGTGAGFYDQLDVRGSFAAGGTLELVIADGFTPLFGMTFNIFNGPTPGYDSGSFLFSTNLGGGLSWDTSALASSGVLAIVPEPSTLALLGGGLLLAATRRRRRKEDLFGAGGCKNSSGNSWRKI